jgi:predicted enzyme related to lactoylglutathione lyase
MADNPHGKFVWNELMTHDVEKAKSFYKDVIGWSYESMPGPENSTYWIVKNGGERAGGLFPMVKPELRDVPEQWVSYIAVDDVDARVKKATASGAMLMRPISDVPGVGRIAILREPGGAGIGWITPVKS